MTSMFSVSVMDPLVIDTRSPVPSYRQLADQLRERIVSGQIEPDAPLPSITYIRGETGLAVGTIRQAVALLVTEGHAYTVPGRGTFARDASADPGLL
jgi:DNA-binding GntR family transcriptional regulator